MARDWEATIRSWTKPPSDSEATKCENAERMIRRAIASSEEMAALDIRVFAQGSYRNNTNVRLDSDVDICVCCTTFLFTEYWSSITDSETNIGRNIAYSYSQFKNQVETALVSCFGREEVIRGDKAFDLHSNTYRVDADVVAAWEHRRYERRQDGSVYYLSGTQFTSDAGRVVINWPQQHYERGVAKNLATGRRYKEIVRALKRLRNEMRENGIDAAKPVPSFLIESLVFNAPNEGFCRGSYMADMQYILATLYNNTQTDDTCNEWLEVNGLKYLFHATQPWSRHAANAYLLAAWEYIGF